MAPSKTTEPEIVDAELVAGVDNPATPATIGDATPAMPDDSSVLANLTTDTEWSDVHDGDLTGDGAGRIPYLGLNRKVDGGFVNPDTGELTREVDFIWLAKGRSRAQWNDDFGTKNASSAPDCRSFDGITSDPESPDRKTEKCAECPLSRWEDGAPPECKESIEALVFLPDPAGIGRLARVRFGGIAVGPARAFWDSFSTRLPKRPPIAYVSRATLEPVETDNGKFLAPRFERVSELARRDAQPLIEERDRRLADWKADVEDEVVRGASAEGDGTANETPPGPDGEPGRQYAEDEEPF